MKDPVHGRNGISGRSIAVLVAIVVLSAAIFVSPNYHYVRDWGFDLTWKSLFEHAAYNRVVIFPDYLQHGFIRRGLSGTLTRLFGEDAQLAFLGYVVFSYAFLTVPLALLAARLARIVAVLPLILLVVVLLFSPQTYIGWANDLGRTDLLATGFVAWATLAVSFDRRWTGVALVLAGLLVHETAYVFGAPLLVMTFWEDWRTGSIDLRQGVRLVAGLVVGAVAILILQAATSASPEALSASMVAAFPVGEADRLIRDLAIYMAAGGSRALRSAVCHNFDLNPKWFVTGVASVAVLAAYAVILPLWRRPLALLLAVFVPLLFMLVIANDVGRWLKLAVVNAWLLTAVLAIRHASFRQRTLPSILAGFAVLGVLLAMGYTPFDDVNAYSRRIIAERGYRYEMSIEGWLDRCDPRWREIVYAKP